MTTLPGLSPGAGAGTSTGGRARGRGWRLPTSWRLRWPSGQALSAVRSVTASPGSLALVILAGLGVWLLLFTGVLSGFQEQRSQRSLYAQFRAELAGETAPLGGAIRNGQPVALLTLPAAGLHHVVISQGTSGAVLSTGPGHLPGTPLPGQAGVSVVYGRALTFGGPFGQLSALKKGDPFTLTTAQGVNDYQVLDVRQPGEPVPAPPPAGQSRVTLVTAQGSGWRGGWAPSQILYVDASLVSKVQPAPAGGAGTPTAADKPMASDTGQLPSLVFWLEALLVGAVLAVWMCRRWGAARSWPIVVPVMLALLWGTSSVAAQLLPNLM